MFILVTKNKEQLLKDEKSYLVFNEQEISEMSSNNFGIFLKIVKQLTEYQDVLICQK